MLYHVFCEFSYLRSFYPPRIVVVRVIAVAVVLTGISFSSE